MHIVCAFCMRITGSVSMCTKVGCVTAVQVLWCTQFWCFSFYIAPYGINTVDILMQLHCSKPQYTVMH